MTDKKRIRLEERLADFTDRLMAGEAPDKPDGSNSERDLEGLLATVEKAQHVFHATQPDPALQNRIRARLAAEWHKSGPLVQSAKKGWFSSRKKKQVFILRFATITAMLAILAGFVAPRIDGALSGAAQNKGVALIIVGLVLAILVLILFWTPRKP